MANDKADGLARVDRMEKNSLTHRDSGAPVEKKTGPAYGGSTAGNPTSGGKIKK